MRSRSRVAEDAPSSTESLVYIESPVKVSNNKFLVDDEDDDEDNIDLDVELVVLDDTPQVETHVLISFTLVRRN